MVDVSTAKNVILRDADGNYVIPYTDKQDKLGYTPEDVANKAASLNSPSDTTYPTTKAVSDSLSGKQAKLTAGVNITIDENNVISASGGLSEVSWGGITGDITNQTDLKNALEAKQSGLTEAQLAAANSGITSTKVSTYDGYATTLGNKADKSTTYTKTEVNTELGKKQDTITDLATIRSGAALGATALQSYTETDPVYTADKPSIALKSELPTKVSQLTNDSGYLTSHQDISGKADKSDTYTKSEVDAKVSSVYRIKGSVASYDKLPTTGQVVGDVYNVLDTGANYVWTADGWDKLSETVDISGKADKSYVDTELAKKQDTISDLATIRSGAALGATALQSVPSTYALKTDIPTKVSAFTNDSGYLTSHQDISGKADKATTLAGYGITDAKITDGVITLGNETITPLTSHQDISGKADKANTLAGYGITDAKITDGVITLGADTITPITSHQDISGKADKSDTYTKTEVNTELGKKQDTISDLATIRSGAALGATALQSVPSEYVTETELSAYHDSSKQDKLTAGTNIKIENNTVSVTGDLGSKVTFRDWSVAS